MKTRVSLKYLVNDCSLFYSTNARHERHGYNTNDMSAIGVRHERQEQYELDTNKTKLKNKVTLGSFQTFAYVSSCFHLKSFTWERDCQMSSKLKSHEIDQSHCRKLL